uniref:Protein ENL-like n=1 Tax=Elaeophora elaphi TaxID=1147741 RepID=A0A0R3RKB3_9BILA
MASDDKRASPKKKGKKRSDNESDEVTKEVMENFMSKVCARFEKLHVMSRLMEEPEEQTTQSGSETRRKSKKSRKLADNVYDFFCDQPSTSTLKGQKSPSKTKQSETKCLESADQASKNVEAEEIDIVDLSEQSGSGLSDTSPFVGQPYIEDPEQPSTSTGLRSKIVLDDETIERILGPPPDFDHEDMDLAKKPKMNEKPKLSSLCGIHKKTRMSTHPESTDTTESHLRQAAQSSNFHFELPSKFQEKQSKDGKTTNTGDSDKIDLKNIKAEDIRGRIIFELNEIPESQPVVSVPVKIDRAQRARERLRRKFEEGHNVTSTKTRGRGWNA